LAYRGRGPRFVPPPEETHRINRKIRTPQVRLIGTAGEQIGIVPIEDALRLAEQAQLDLVEKESEAKKKSTVTTVKELRLGYRTDTGDIERQITKARTFLEAGDRVKFLLRFRGREMAYQNLGREKLMGVCDALKDVAVAESTPRMEGRMMGILLAPSRKKSAPKPTKPAAKEAAAPNDAPAKPAGGPTPPERIHTAGAGTAPA